MKQRVSIGLSLGMAIFLMAILLFQISQTPSLSDVKKNFGTLDRVVLDRSGRLVDEVRVETKNRRLAWVSFKQAPHHLIAAVIQAEGKGPLSLATQLTDLLVPQSQTKIFKVLAFRLKWSNREMVEAYLNLVSYRAELQGLAAASFGLFDKAPSELSRPQAAVLVALIRSSTVATEDVKSRACAILQATGAPEDCALVTLDHLSYLEKGFQIRPYVNFAPQFARALVADPSFKNQNMIRSTLDRDVQWVVLDALQKQALIGAAAVVIENSTGNVLAYVGNMGSSLRDREVDGVINLKQAGPVLKPLIFAKAFDEKILTTTSLMQDSLLASVSVRTALAANLSLPAVRTLELVGVEVFVQVMSALGFTDLYRADFYGPSLALGSVDVRLLELTNAYRTLVNRGVWSPVRMSPELSLTETSRRVFSEEAAFLLTNILSDRKQSDLWAAVQKGSSRDMQNHWCIGFTEKFTIGLWTGNSFGEPAAELVWQEIANYLHRHEDSVEPVAPAGLVKTGQEWFILGTEPGSELVSLATGLPTKIRYPLDQSFISLETEIPRPSHRFFIQVVAPRSDQNVYLNGRRLGRAQSLLPWEPSMGSYVLEVRDSKGQVVDKVSFEVRGRRPLAYNQ